MRPDRLYKSGQYLDNNPTWDLEDSDWKAAKVLQVINDQGLDPVSICEVGCGAGGVLRKLRIALPTASMHGYDISPDAKKFWQQHADAGVEFVVGDFLEHQNEHYDLILLLDVIEHIADPWSFLETLRTRGNVFLFHVPLDLSAQNILREWPILMARRQVGHIHYFTKALFLELLRETGYEVVLEHYSGLSISGPRASWRSKLAYLPRMLAYAINKDWGVRLLGGETLLVVARAKA